MVQSLKFHLGVAVSAFSVLIQPTHIPSETSRHRRSIDLVTYQNLSMTFSFLNSTKQQIW